MDEPSKTLPTIPRKASSWGFQGHSPGAIMPLWPWAACGRSFPPWYGPVPSGTQDLVVGRTTGNADALGVETGPLLPSPQPLATADKQPQASEGAQHTTA